MLENLLFLAVISSGSIGCVAFYNRKYENVLPITCIGMVLLLFLFGILGHLKLGFYTILAIAFIIYLFTAIYLLKHKSYKTFFQNMITPGSIIFLIAFCVLSVLNYGRLASAWDEFSHWMDIVKVMATLDDFGTNPAAHSFAMSYPPGMSLFQYFLQKCCLLVHPDGVFNEWRAYLAYQIFFFGISAPFFQKCFFKKPFGILLVFVIVYFSPLVFFTSIYSSIYIDPFVGILAGCGFAAIITQEEKDNFYLVYICLLCSMLVLAKDIGAFFAVFLAAACIADFILQKQSRKRTLVCMCSIFLATGLPRFLWDYEVGLSLADKAFSEKISILTVLNVFLGKDNSYRKTVLEKYENRLIDAGIPIGNTGVQINYICFIVAMIVFSFVIYRMIMSQTTAPRFSIICTFVIEHGMLLCYIFVLCVIYVFLFSEYEAVRLASFARYINTAFLCVWFTNLLALSDVLICHADKFRNQQLFLLCMIALLVIGAPGKPIYQFVTRKTVESSISKRSKYEKLTKKIMNTCDGTATIYFISQGNNGSDFVITKFNVRPNLLNEAYGEAGSTWSLGGPFYDGDIWYVDKTPEEWWGELEANCDYVAIYKLNDYFLETYGNLFENLEEIAENELYIVNKEAGLLQRVK